jgi:hypothetical protein
MNKKVQAIIDKHMGKSAGKSKTRYYMIVRVNDKTGERIDLFPELMTHKKALVLKSKVIQDRALPKHLRNVIEERKGQTPWWDK